MVLELEWLVSYLSLGQLDTCWAINVCLLRKQLMMFGEKRALMVGCGQWRQSKLIYSLWNKYSCEFGMSVLYHLCACVPVWQGWINSLSSQAIKNVHKNCRLPADDGMFILIYLSICWFLKVFQENPILAGVLLQIYNVWWKMTL